MRILSLAALFVAASAASTAVRSAPVQSAAPPPAHEVAAALQKKYDAVRDFSADFTHNFEGGVLGKKMTEQGAVQIKKPGKMRWDYKAPQKKTFVSDGRRMYAYFPDDNEVMITPVPEEDQATSAILFLAGKGNLTRDFAVSFAGGGSADTYALKLQPKLQDRDYDWLQVVVDRTSLRIRSLSFEDKQGGRSTFQFSNFKENTGLSDKTFLFKIPRGAEVITNGSPSR